MRTREAAIGIADDNGRNESLPRLLRVTDAGNDWRDHLIFQMNVNVGVVIVVTIKVTVVGWGIESRAQVGRIAVVVD